MVDYGEATVLTGLTECHVHLVADGGVQALDRVSGRSQAELDATIIESAPSRRRSVFGAR
jgi:hypothetical protein